MTSFMAAPAGARLLSENFGCNARAGPRAKARCSALALGRSSEARWAPSARKSRAVCGGAPRRIERGYESCNTGWAERLSVKEDLPMLAELRVTPVGPGIPFLRLIADLLPILAASRLQYQVHAAGPAGRLGAGRRVPRGHARAGSQPRAQADEGTRI